MRIYLICDVSTILLWNLYHFLKWQKVFLVALYCRLVAYALNALSLDKGSAIAIDMPMNVNSVVIYLAIVLAGYIVVSIADSFASLEISTRLRISKAKAIFTQVKILFLTTDNNLSQLLGYSWKYWGSRWSL